MMIVCWKTSYIVKVTEIGMTWISGTFTVENDPTPFLTGSFPWEYITSITMIK